MNEEVTVGQVVRGIENLLVLSQEDSERLTLRGLNLSIKATKDFLMHWSGAKHIPGLQAEAQRLKKVRGAGRLNAPF